MQFSSTLTSQALLHAEPHTQSQGELLLSGPRAHRQPGPSLWKMSDEGG